MVKISARVLAFGLSAFSLPACLVIPPPATPDNQPNVQQPNNGAWNGGQNPGGLPGSPSVMAAPNTVRRLPPPVPAQPMQPQNQPMQYVTLPPEKIIYDQFGRPVSTVGVDFSSLPPGTQVLAPTQVPQSMPQQSPMQQAQAIMPTPSSDAVEVVAVTHTLEPPMNPAEPPKLKPMMMRQPELLPPPLPQPPAVPPMPAKNSSAPLVNNTPFNGNYTPPVVNNTPPFVPPGAQVLVLQPNGPSPSLQPASHNNPANDAVPSLINPSVQPEELRLVSSPKSAVSNLTPLLMAVRAYQEKNPQDAERLLASLDPVNRDLLAKLLPLAVRLGETGLPAVDPAELAELVDQLQNIVGSLRTKAALRIEKLCYCRSAAKPVRYGTYQPLPEDYAFHAGETVELYMELRNFSCEAKDKEFLTHLATAIEIRDERGELASRFEFERDRPEVGQAPRQEYFHICRFPLQGLAAGHYTLTAQVTDVPTGKTAKKTMTLQVEPVRRVVRGTAG